jgi:hypothetical protein
MGAGDADGIADVKLVQRAPELLLIVDGGAIQRVETIAGVQIGTAPQCAREEDP